MSLVFKAMELNDLRRLNIKEHSRTKNFLLIVSTIVMASNSESHNLCIQNWKIYSSTSFTNENTRESQGLEAVYPRSESELVAESGLEKSSPNSQSIIPTFI